MAFFCRNLGVKADKAASIRLWCNTATSQILEAGTSDCCLINYFNNYLFIKIYLWLIFFQLNVSVCVCPYSTERVCDFIRERDFEVIKPDGSLSGILHQCRVISLLGKLLSVISFHSLFTSFLTELFCLSSSQCLRLLHLSAFLNFQLLDRHDKWHSPILPQEKACQTKRTPVHTVFCLTLSETPVSVGELVLFSLNQCFTWEKCVWLTKINYSQYVSAYAGLYVFAAIRQCVRAQTKMPDTHTRTHTHKTYWNIQNLTPGG